jgi:hypothetical protein
MRSRAMKVSCGDEDKSRVTTVCDEKLVLLGGESERVGRLEASDALEMLAGVEIEHLDRMVDLSGDEEMVAFEVDCKVIEVTRDLR